MKTAIIACGALAREVVARRGHAHVVVGAGVVVLGEVEALRAGVRAAARGEAVLLRAAAADAAVDVALRAYAGGASLSEATSEGRRLVDGWARHPSRHHGRRMGSLRLAS